MTKFTALFILVLLIGLVGCKRDSGVDAPPKQTQPPAETAINIEGDKTEVPQKLESDIAPAETKPAETPSEKVIVPEEKPDKVKPLLIGPVEEKPVEKGTAKPDSKAVPVDETSKKDKKKSGPSVKDMEFFKNCDFVFKNFVDKNGRVDYLRLRRKKIELLNACRQIGNVPPVMRLSWSKNNEKAFLLNAHNILTLKLIIDNYPIKPNRWSFLFPTNSIKQIPGAREKKFFRLAGFRYTLDEIEEELLKFSNDPRYCFAISNSTVSGGLLRNEAYDPNKLDKQIDEQVKKFLAIPKNLRINSKENKVHLSSMFKLKNFKDSFLKSKYATIKRFREKKAEERAILNFIYLNIDQKKADEIELNNYDVKFETYDWLLNEQPVK
jgi:hypothetical protein